MAAPPRGCFGRREFAEKHSVHTRVPVQAMAWPHGPAPLRRRALDRPFADARLPMRSFTLACPRARPACRAPRASTRSNGGSMSSLGKELSTHFDRELRHVADEIGAYRDEKNLWVMLGAQRNAPGTLALHLAGNLLHYVGAELGDTGYVRDRPAEFGDRDVPRDALLRRLE